MRLRGFLVVLTLVLGVFVAAGGSASATATTVATEAEFRAALVSLAGDTGGPHTVTLTEDIVLAGATDPTYSAARALTIDGDGHTLDGNGNSRVLSGDSTAGLTLRDIRIEGGSASTGGGGALKWVGPVVIETSHLVGNHISGTGLQFGGAAFVNGPLTITDSRIAESSATSSTSNAIGGAVYIDGVNTLSVTRSVVEGNSASSATALGSAGALLTNGSMTIVDSVVLDNEAMGATASSGALRPSGTSSISGAIITGNEVTSTSSIADGGAIGQVSGTLTISDSSIWDNAVTGVSVARGGAMSLIAALTVTDSTIAGNTATSGGGAYGGIYNSGPVTLDHVTLVDNVGAQGANVYADSLTATGSAIGGAPTGPNCAVTGSTAVATSVADDGTCGAAVADALALGGLRYNGGPSLDDPVLGDTYRMLTMFPVAGSPLIDAQPGVDCVDNLDQRGEARPFGTGCDAGAVEAVFGPHPFSDVPGWVEDSVRWVASPVNDPQLMTGITPTTFRPNDSISRAQVVRLLYREAGAPNVSGFPPHGFTDVPVWVEDAVRWAKSEGIADGITATTFVPNAPITRAQVVRMKYRLAESPEVSGLPAHPFSDVPAWVQDAVRWAADTDNPLPLVTGITATTFRPNDDITRAQVARMDYRLALTPEVWDDADGAPLAMIFASSLK